MIMKPSVNNYNWERGDVMSIRESGENYLEAILILSKQQEHVRSIDVAGFLGVTKPSVSRAMSILKAEGFVVSDANGALVLTEKGMDVAQSMYERHKLLTEFLVSLGVSRETAAEDACRIEHVISKESFELLRNHAKETIGSN
jgi:Mn-dependent DtxR family transcriptional regulator